MLLRCSISVTSASRCEISAAWDASQASKSPLFGHRLGGQIGLVTVEVLDERADRELPPGGIGRRACARPCAGVQAEARADREEAPAELDDIGRSASAASRCRRRRPGSRAWRPAPPSAAGTPSPARAATRRASSAFWESGKISPRRAASAPTPGLKAWVTPAMSSAPGTRRNQAAVRSIRRSAASSISVCTEAGTCCRAPSPPPRARRDRRCRARCRRRAHCRRGRGPCARPCRATKVMPQRLTSSLATHVAMISRRRRCASICGRNCSTSAGGK